MNISFLLPSEKQHSVPRVGLLFLQKNEMDDNRLELVGKKILYVYALGHLHEFCICILNGNELLCNYPEESCWEIKPKGGKYVLKHFHVSNTKHGHCTLAFREVVFTSITVKNFMRQATNSYPTEQ